MSANYIRGVTDADGLTLPNRFLNLFIPATNTSVILYVKNRRNPNYDLMNYGPLPTTSSSQFTNYSGLAGGSGGGSSRTTSPPSIEPIISTGA